MRHPAPIEYAGVRTVAGPLLIIDGIAGAGWDEHVEVRLANGEVRQGVVLEVDRDLAVIEVFQGTAGIDPQAATVVFSGSPFRIPVGEGWLGRICNGRGDPIDGGPPIFGDTASEVGGRPINPSARVPPSEAIVTGISAVDGLATLVRGQKLPIFSVAGLPHLELAAQVAAQARVEGEPFRVLFAAMGITHADADLVRETLEARAAGGDLALFVNTADDPVIERILAPRLALTVAEHLAFELGQHVLVVMADMTSYCEAVREVASARGEAPGRRGFPGYLYSDLASIYERCGRIRGRPGSITQLPVLSMPAGDITHPVPDLTGYITEGQLVLGPELQSRGVYPPFDPLSSLSRLMRRGAGPRHTRDDHLLLAAQIYAALARARQVLETAELVGETSLSETDRRFLRFASQLESGLLAQGRTEARSLNETLDRAWQVLGVLPRAELTILAADMVETHLGKEDGL